MDKTKKSCQHYFMREIKRIILHATASSRAEDNTIGAIRCLHMISHDKIVRWANTIVRGNDFLDIGYHGFIDPLGIFWEGRKDHTIGAHCLGFNHDSLGYCIAGNKIQDFTPVMFRSLANVVASKIIKYDLTINNVHGHSEFNKNKLCPIFNVCEFKDIYLIDAIKSISKE